MKSKMSILLITLIVCSLALTATPQFSMAQTGTNVSGIISSDTTWTKIGSPYNLVGNILVAEGATLTIQSDVTVNLDSYYMQINGTLSAKGTNAEPIKIFSDCSYIRFGSTAESWDEQKSTGNLIENSIINSTVIIISGSCPKINNNVFENGKNDIFLDSAIFADNGIISNNTFDGKIGYSSGAFSVNKAITCSGNATIQDNIFTSWQVAAIWIEEGNPIIQRNLILNNNGFPSEYSASGAIVVKGASSTIFNPKVTNPLIQDNTIANNKIGILITDYNAPNAIPTPTIRNNNIYNNQYNIYMFRGSFNVSVSDNWWGTTDNQAIQQTIFDFNDDFSVGTVQYTPFLTEPNPNAPDIPPEPTPTPTPTPTPAPTATPTPTPTVTPSPTPTSTLTPTNTPQPTMTPTPTLTFTPTPTVDPTQSPTPANEETPTPSPTVEPTATTQPTNSLSPTLSPSQEPTASPDQTQMQALPQEALYGAVAAVIIVIAVVVVLALRKRK